MFCRTKYLEVSQHRIDALTTELFRAFNVLISKRDIVSRIDEKYLIRTPFHTSHLSGWGYQTTFCEVLALNNPFDYLTYLESTWKCSSSLP